MSTMKKQKITLDEAAALMADIVNEDLESLPPMERKRRTEKAYKRVKDYLKLSKKIDVSSTPVKSDCTVHHPLAARNHR